MIERDMNVIGVCWKIAHVVFITLGRDFAEALSGAVDRFSKFKHRPNRLVMSLASSPAT